MTATEKKEKIQKLLRLSESPNINEAESAMEKAYQLMREWKLSDKDVNSAVGNIETYQYKNVRGRPNMERHILGSCTRLFNGDVFFQSKWEQGYKTQRVYAVIVGTQATIADSVILFDYLIGTMKRAVKNFKGHKISFRSGFYAAILTKLSKMLDEQEKRAKNPQNKSDRVENALMVVEQNAVQAFLKEKFPDVKETSFKDMSYLGNFADYSEGIDLASNMAINKSVSSGEVKSIA